MKSFRLGRPSPAMVVAFIALLAALAPTAGALRGSRTISKDDFRTGAVDKRAVGTNQIAKLEIRRDNVGINELAEEGETDGGIDGRQIVESKLGKVPSAATVDTLRIVKAKLSVGQSATLVDNGTVKLVARCDQVGGAQRVRVLGETTAAGAYLDGAVDRTGAGGSGARLEPGTPDDQRVLAANTTGAGGQDDVSADGGQGFVAAASGPYIGVSSDSLLLGLNAFGATCSVHGPVFLGAV
jgi:hypothetical protein